MKRDPQRAKPSEVRVRENLQNTLTRKFVDLAKDYQNRQVKLSSAREGYGRGGYCGVPCLQGKMNAEVQRDLHSNSHDTVAHLEWSLYPVRPSRQYGRVNLQF